MEARRGEVVILDARGQLLAQVRYTEKGWGPLRSSAWTAVPRKAQPGWIIVAEPDQLVGYTLSPAK